MCSKCHRAFIKTTCSAKVNNSFLYSSKWFSLSFFTFNLSIQSLWQEKLQANSKFSAQLGTGVVWAERGTPLKSCSPLFLHCAVPNLTLFFQPNSVCLLHWALARYIMLANIWFRKGSSFLFFLCLLTRKLAFTKFILSSYVDLTWIRIPTKEIRV